MYRYEKRRSRTKSVLGILLLMAIVSFASIYLYKMYTSINVGQNHQVNDESGGIVRLSAEEDNKYDISEIISNTTKSVVGISKIKNKGDSILEGNATSNLSLGTGTIISENGYIITNWHLVGNKYNSCYVTLEDGSVSSGNVVWADSNLDLAIVKIEQNELTYLKLGDSDNIKIGENVYAIGNPIGLEFQRTVTSGIISGLNRTIKIADEETLSYMEGLIQTDASINQGNSGGPLINERGEVIGINSVKIETAEGIGFAVPINTIKPIIESLVQTGKFEEAYLGIFAYDSEVTRYLENDVEFDSGIYVVKIMRDSAVSNTNIKIGDIITKIDGNNIERMCELRNYIYTKKPGDTVSLTIKRNNKEYEVDVKLNKR